MKWYVEAELKKQGVRYKRNVYCQVARGNEGTNGNRRLGRNGERRPLTFQELIARRRAPLQVCN